MADSRRFPPVEATRNSSGPGPRAVGFSTAGFSAAELSGGALPLGAGRKNLGAAALLLATLAGCGGGGGSGAPVTPGTTQQPELLRVEYGRLVDVYGLQITNEGAIPALYRRDVVIGGNIEDQRPSNSTLRDDEVTYDFQSADPDTLQPKLFIPRDLTGSEFKVAFDALDDQLREVTPMLYGTNGPGTPFSVVPRNAALKLTFTAALGVDDAFFVERNAQGQVTGLRNTEAVQLLRIEADPAQSNAFVPMPVRVLAEDRTLVLDPVLLGTEGLQYQTNNNAAGLPPSPDQLGANIRIALALEGPLAIPRLRSATSDLTGLNNSGRRSVVRDFRSGNAADTSSDLARGFVRDPLPLRLIGEIVMYLEKVENVNSFTQEVTIYKNGVTHEIDRGDVFRFVSDSSGLPFGSSEVVVDPVDDFNNASAQHVRVRVRRVAGAGLESIDPRNIPGYPSDLAAREPWLVANAPRAICVCEFTAGGDPLRDDSRNFLVFSPSPLPLGGVQPAPNEFVSPYAGAVIRFTKPVDLETVKWADTFFFAMRDLTTTTSIEDFIANRPWTNGAANGTGMNPSSFSEAKYRTPYMVTSRVFDEDGSQTQLRLQPTSGFFLNDAMRSLPAGSEFLNYYLHLISSSSDGGIRDLAGNPLDLQGTTANSSSSVVIEFTIDTRSNAGAPVFANNLAVSVVRRFAARDEDANPSYFLPNEVQPASVPSRAASYPLEDLFGGFVYLDNKLRARPTTRTRVVADNLNQSPVVPPTQPPAPPNALASCPPVVGGEIQVATNSATNVVNAGIQNPLNPFGCRLQTLWREIDLSLSRTDAFDFNLDIEQMYWAPFTQTNLSFDEFDNVSLTLGHSEFRPMPCVGDFSSLPSLPDSGLSTTFERNFAWNPSPVGSGNVIESQSRRRSVYGPDGSPQTFAVPLTIDPSTIVFENNGVNRFLPLPPFQRPYFVYRDETVYEQGGRSDPSGSDINSSLHTPHLASPFSMGQGRRWLDPNGTPGNVQFASSFWNDGRNQRLTSGADDFTGGLVGNIGLPLLADFWTFCDSSELPAGGGYVALGTNGWQVAVTVQSDPRPNFRVLSAGRAALQNGQPPVCRSPSDSQWNIASGGFTAGPPAGTTPPGDNTFYWIMMDVLKRQSVITNGFIDLHNPHRVPEGFADPRLGPYFLAGGVSTLPNGVLPSFTYEFDPPLSQLPAGTSLVPQFRGASVVDTTPWYWNAWMSVATTLFPTANYDANMRQQLRPTADNFPLDPYKAGDAHMRKWDTRPIPGSSARNWWTYLYNRTVTRYVEDPNQLMDPAFTIQYAGPNEAFTPRDVRYVNWRFVTSNNTDANPPTAPTIETFALSYRFQSQ